MRVRVQVGSQLTAGDEPAGGRVEDQNETHDDVIILQHNPLTAVHLHRLDLSVQCRFSSHGYRVVSLGKGELAAGRLVAVPRGGQLVCRPDISSAIAGTQPPPYQPYHDSDSDWRHTLQQAHPHVLLGLGLHFDAVDHGFAGEKGQKYRHALGQRQAHEWPATNGSPKPPSPLPKTHSVIHE